MEPRGRIGSAAGARSDRRAHKGRGAVTNEGGRYERTRFVAEDDGWGILDEIPPSPETVVIPEVTRRIITRNDSPDIPFDRSINPYKGCEHGCAYCFARPTHAYLGLSPGLTETRIFPTRRRPSRGASSQRRGIGARSWPEPTPPLPAGRAQAADLRAILEVLAEHRHPSAS
jgi:hypothetical protein